VIAAVAISLPAFGADGALLHEYVPYDPSTDGDLGAVTIQGGFAAELDTRSGKVTAPDVERPIGERTPKYGTKSSVPDTAYVPDRDTKRPDTLQYDDPFRPSVAPFKRLIAFDAVESDYRLVVREARAVGVDLAHEDDPAGAVDSFYADVALELVPGDKIRIPTPIAGAKIKKAHLSAGSMAFHFERDSAENLFVVAAGSGSARLILEMATPRDAFAGETSAYDWHELRKDLLPPLPSNVQAAADSVAKELGIDKTRRPSAAIRELVTFFRSFKESSDPPPSTGDIYLDLVHSKKGVCRHRAFAFMVTALGLGIPARFVGNEAHAWVEVHDGYVWRRIDLGGAGRVLDDKSEKPEKPQPRHDPPSDPYAWPSGATKGSDLLPPTTAPTTSPTTSPTGTGTTSPSTTPPSTAPPSKVTLNLSGATGADPMEIQRQKTLSVKGHLNASDGTPCKRVRIEIVLQKSGGGTERAAGVLATDDAGDYDGTVTIPSDLALGDYTVVAKTPGAGTCGQGTSE
jgi:transglutaminase-like putative cysteine protease